MNKKEILSSKVDLISKALQNISYHIQSNQWEHTKDYYEGNGVETL